MNLHIDRITTAAPVCATCKHFYKDGEGLSCRAYPKGIPEDILSLEDNHDKVRSDQKGNWIYEKGDGTYINP